MVTWFTVRLDDRPGSLARVAGARGERGINITGIVGVAEDTGGALMPTTSDPAGTRAALGALGSPAGSTTPATRFRAGSRASGTASRSAASMSRRGIPVDAERFHGGSIGDAGGTTGGTAEDAGAGGPWVQTVTGRVPASSLGFTLPHEHTGCELWHVQNRWDYWELIRDEDVIAPELERFRDLGGTCLADVTNHGLGRDPERLRRLSERTGLLVVMGSGWYRQAYYPPDALIDRRSVDDLADEIVREFRDGAGRTGIRPGIIGEIGSDKPWLASQEERVFRAAARAARRTGLAVTTHAAQSAVGLAQLGVLVEEGLDPARVVVGHADSYPYLDYHLEVLERGANIEYDFLGMRFSKVDELIEPRVIGLLCELLDRGHGDRILLSQDVCHTAQLRSFGGNGYTYLQETFLPRLREQGIGEEAIARLTVDNPRRVLSLVRPEG